MIINRIVNGLSNIDNNVLDTTINILANGGVIVLPSDTNYNLICDVESKKAVDRIFQIKQRPKNKSLSLFFANKNDWKKYGYSLNKDVDKIVDYYWPGPLNIVLNKTSSVPDYILENGDTVALGCISHPIWQKVIQAYKKPVALTSANKSGFVNDAIVTKEIAWSHVGMEVDMFFCDLDTIVVRTTKSSTIISCVDNNLKILRSGDISFEQINKIINDAE